MPLTTERQARNARVIAARQARHPLRNALSRQANVPVVGTGLGTGHVPRQNVAHIRNPAARGR